MDKQLGDDDAFAVDLLLNRTNMVNNGNNGSGVFASPVGDAVVRRMGAVESIFRLVAEMPAGDPSPGLARRTVDRIWQRSAMPAPLPGHQPEVGPNA